MIDLSKLTFIIPIRIESTDRYHNIKSLLGYLNNSFSTNVKIYEIYEERSKLDFLKDFKNLKIEHYSEKLLNVDCFHRTRYLNIMLNDTLTELVTNYDCDVLLPKKTYKDVYDHLLQNKSDFVYPFIFGEGQKKLHYSKWHEDRNKELLYWSMIKFLETFDLSYLENEDTFITNSESFFGHCFFAKTSSYKLAYGENEEFISYGPEDVERAERFKKLDFKVDWWNTYIFHLEHTRTNDSSVENPHFHNNVNLYNKLKSLNKEDLIDYYENLKIKINI